MSDKIYITSEQIFKKYLQKTLKEKIKEQKKTEISLVKMKKEVEILEKFIFLLTKSKEEKTTSKPESVF